MMKALRKFIMWGGGGLLAAFVLHGAVTIDKFTASLMMGVAVGVLIGIALAAFTLAGAQQPASPVLEPTRYSVVESDVIVLPGSAKPQIEVKP